MNERQLYSPLIKGAMMDGWLLYRIADSPYGLKPFDIGGFTPEGTGVACEVKIARTPKDLESFCLFNDHQVAWLNTAMKTKAVSIAPVYLSYAQKEMRVYVFRRDIVARGLCDLPYHVLVKKNEVYRGWKELNA